MSIQKGFHPFKTITQSEDLCIWNKPDGFLDEVTKSTLGTGSFLLLGEHLSGKTSLINCLIERLETKSSSFLPVLIDFHSRPDHRSLGTQGGYSLIMQNIIAAMRKKNRDFFENSPDDQKIGIKCPLFSKNNDDLINFSISINEFTRMLDDVESIVTDNKKSLALIFDSYDCLHTVFFDNPNTFFFPFRDKQQYYSITSGGIFPILSGRESTESYQSETGSDQFNQITSTHKVLPFTKEEFKEFWEERLADLNEHQRDILNGYADDAQIIFEQTGGFPGLTKVLVQGILANGSDVEPLEVLHRQFRNIFGRQPKESQKALVDLACQNTGAKIDRQTLVRLRELSLITKDRQNPQIIGSLWQEWLKTFGREYFPDIETKDKSVYGFEHAGDMANYLLSHSYIPEMLEWLNINRDGENEWLEFKSGLNATKAQLEEMSLNNRRTFNKDDITWRVVEAIIALHNTRGGLLLIGVKDDGSIADLPPMGKLAPVDYIRDNIIRILEKVSKPNTRLILGDNTGWHLKYNEDWLKQPWITPHLIHINDKHIVAMAIDPIKSKEDALFASKYDSSGKIIAEYFLVRGIGEVETLVQHDDIDNFFKSRFPIKTADLEIFITRFESWKKKKDEALKTNI